MKVETPGSIGQLVELMRDCQSNKKRIEIAGARSKQRMGGPVAEADVQIGMRGMERVLAYDPRDLTISVEAGMKYHDLRAILAEKKQFLPIEPAFAAEATVGGILATHSSGHRRRLFGTVRDLVIGMKLVTLRGRVVESGGMVVKNVAGLDFAKLMTGSFGTLAAVATVNFKLMPAPVGARTFLYQNVSPGEVFRKRNEVLKGVLQPASVDYLNPAAAARVGLPERHALVLEALGSEAVLGRYQKELAEWSVIENTVWDQVREFTPQWLSEHPAGHVVRVSTQLQEMEAALGRLPADSAVVGRAANGVLLAHTPGAATVPAGLKAVIEYSPSQRQGAEQLWPAPGNDFFLMKKIKDYFDPDGLLNPGRLYGRI
jgi:glycolate oxidase FAD binding subunit